MMRMRSGGGGISATPQAVWCAIGPLRKRVRHQRISMSVPSRSAVAEPRVSGAIVAAALAAAAAGAADDDALELFGDFDGDEPAEPDAPDVPGPPELWELALAGESEERPPLPAAEGSLGWD
eukprot:1524222-Pyramimonas_sp.AAC.1